MPPLPPIARPEGSTSREQVARIDRAYFHTPNHFAVARRWLILLALLLGVGWCAWGAWDQPRHHSPGAVAHVHAPWEHDCETCHQPLSPIRDNTWLTTPLTRQASDAACEACHRVASHTSRQIAHEVGSCASCHADHLGRSADLTRVSDQTCTACHAQIARHRVSVQPPADGPASSDAPITRFDNEHHPAFASLMKDPGRLKFSHGRHMRLGLTFGPTASSARPADATLWTYGQMSAGDQARYRPEGGSPSDPVQLACSSCHAFAPSLADGDLRVISAFVAGAAPGAYPLPVTFENHCAACHALPTSGTGPNAPDASAAVPHGIDPAGLRQFLEGLALREALAADGAVLREPLLPRPLPASAAAEGKALQDLVEQRVAGSRTFVRGTCQKCHQLEEAPLAAAGSLLPASTAAAREAVWFRVAPTQVPGVWLGKARFNHQAHRSFSCQQCHAAADPASATGTAPAGLPEGGPLDHQMVMIAGRESCVVCHAPTQPAPHGEPIRGGARFDCVECHGYHGSGSHLFLGQAP